jgi:peptide/nickel transport system substrate-binding protein
MRFKKTMAAGLAVAAALALSACGGDSAGNDDAASGTTGHALTIAKPDGAITTQSNNPFVGTGSGMTLGYLNAILEPVGMVNLADPSADVEPWLASQIEWNDDYTAVTLTARDGVTWSDGEAFTADDLAFTFQLRMDNEALNPSALPITGVETDGDQVTVTFETSMFVRQGQVLHVHVLPQHFIETIDDLTTDPLIDLVGTGPYTLTSFTTQAVTLEARDDWWGGDLAVPQLHFVSFNDNTGLITALANGEVDWAQAWITNVDQAFIGHDREHNQQWTPAGLGIDAMFVNTTEAPFDSVAFRQAVNMVIDREAHREIAREGGVPALTSVTGLPSPAGDAFVAPEFQGVEFTVDVDGAKAILEDAGYTGVGTALVDPAGNPVTFTLSVPQGWSDYVTGSSLIVDAVKALGVTATLDTPDADTWWTNRSNGNFQAILHWTDTGSTPFDIFDNTMAARWLEPIGEPADFNFGRFEHPEIDGLLSTYANATSDDERAAALERVQEIFVEEVPVMPIGTRPFIISFNTRNFVGWPDAENPFIVSDFTQPTLPMVLQHLTPVS